MESPGPETGDRFPERVVLIVHDDPAALETLERIVAPFDYRISLARSGAQALAALSAFEPDVVVLDLGIVASVEVVSRIRREYPDVPVIVIAEHGAGLAPIEVRRLGVAGYLLKPLEPAAVGIMLAVVLTRRSK